VGYSVSDGRPAWSHAFAPDALQPLRPVSLLDDVTPEWAWGGSTGQGVRVAVIDSGIDADHAAIGGPIAGYASVVDCEEGLSYWTEPHRDVFGHGTACAGIIRSIAPDCELYSVQVLGPALKGRGIVFAAGLRWAIENGAQVCNVSMGTTKKDLSGVLHELADEAYFKNVILVTAANNLPVPAFPSLYASVISVAAHDSTDPYLFYYNPRPPVEFGAPGINLHVAWQDGGWLTATGNSFAAPHITGIVARILGKHPELTPFQVKTVLRGLAANVARDVPPTGGTAVASTP
jgi:subtilisin family serine protease